MLLSLFLMMQTYTKENVPVYEEGVKSLNEDHQ